MKNATAVLFLLIAVFACIPAVPAWADEPVPVIVSILPQRYFVEKIGGPLVQIEVMVAPGAAPEQYEPKPKQMTALGKAKVYFACGVPFESVWLSRMAEANPRMLVVHTEEGIEKRAMEAHSHDHGAGKDSHGHHHDEAGAGDPHIWLSPPLVMLQARTIFETLSAVDPKNGPAYEQNYKNFISELVELDTSLLRLFRSKGAEGGCFMVFHPAWGYFADAYGLKQIPVELEGKEPKPRDLDRIIALAKKLGVRTIFVQPEFSAKSAQTVADAIGAVLVNADVLSPDWAANLRKVSEQFAAVLVRR